MRYILVDASGDIVHEGETLYVTRMVSWDDRGRRRDFKYGHVVDGVFVYREVPGEPQEDPR